MVRFYAGRVQRLVKAARVIITYQHKPKRYTLFSEVKPCEAYVILWLDNDDDVESLDNHDDLALAMWF